jgi:hypothetical protein
MVITFSVHTGNHLRFIFIFHLTVGYIHLLIVDDSLLLASVRVSFLGWNREHQLCRTRT